MREGERVVVDIRSTQMGLTLFQIFTKKSLNNVTMKESSIGVLKECNPNVQR